MKKLNFYLFIISGLLLGILLVVIAKLPRIVELNPLAPILESIGISIATLCGISMLWQQISEKALFELIAGHLELSKSAGSLGIARIFKDRNEASEAIKTVLERARGEVLLLGGALTTFFLVPTNLMNLDEFLESNNNVRKIKILMPDPYSRGTELRSIIDHGHQPGYSFEPISSTQRNCLVKASFLQKRYPNRVMIRTYDMFPQCFVVLTNTQLFWQPYDCSDRGVTAPVIQAHSSSRLYKRYRDHFNRIWGDQRLSSHLDSEITNNTDMTIVGS